MISKHQANRYMSADQIEDMPLFSGLMISLRRTSVLESADQMENTENLCSLDYCYGEPLKDTEHEAGKLYYLPLMCPLT
ncbi:unnamed protein product [Boreogadus saida]